MTTGNPEQHIVAPLVETLSRTTNSYKFLFFKALLDTLNVTGNMLVERNPVPLWEIYALMFANAWYPVAQFRLSLGAADPIPRYIHQYSQRSGRALIERKEAVGLFHPDSHNTDILELAAQLDLYVKYRFLRPWLAEKIKGVPDQQVNREIARLLTEDSRGDKNCPYHFHVAADGQEYIEIAPRFADYLQRNGPIIYDWWRWKFANYLAARNPYSPSILGKLEAPGERDLNLARFYWKFIMAHSQEPIRCIYTGQPLDSSLSIDHFIPWTFVLHDRLWNLVPTTSPVNSSKSDGLPSLDAFRKPFISLQLSALEVVASQSANLPKPRKAAIMNDHTITDSQPSLLKLSEEGQASVIRELIETTVDSLWLNARNQGFPLWQREAS